MKMTIRRHCRYQIRGLRSLLTLALIAAACGCGGQSEPTASSGAKEADRSVVQQASEARPAPAGTRAVTKPAPATPPGPAAQTTSSTAVSVSVMAPRDASARAPAPIAVAAGKSKAPAPREGATPAARQGPASLEQQLAGLQVPPAWLEGVRTAYDTARPWKDARLEIRRLLSLNTDAARKEAVKLTWIYLKKNDIGDGHEYPMYLFLGGEPLWAVLAHEEFLARPHKETPIHAYLSLASLYTRFGAFDKAKAVLDKAMTGLPGPPWRIARQADLHSAYGDLYAAWGKSDLARENYTEAVRLYPTSNQPYGQHLLKRQAGRVQTKLDLLSAQSLADATLRDGRYTSTALGYAGDLHVTLTVRDGKIADVQVKHEEKIDQGACVIIPRRIVEKQSVLVDGISSATVTKDAIIDGTLGCLRKAGLQ
jgi:uncharacterized protein with FMN-binding domain